jgi:hypothetical protein
MKDIQEFFASINLSEIFDRADEGVAEIAKHIEEENPDLEYPAEQVAHLNHFDRLVFREYLARYHEWLSTQLEARFAACENRSL